MDIIVYDHADDSAAEKQQPAEAAIQAAPVMADNKDPAHVRVYIPRRVKIKDAIKEVGIGKEVEVVVRGEVSSISAHDYSDGINLEIRPTTVRLVAEDEGGSLGDALVEAERTV